jgi:hypothetical protein
MLTEETVEDYSPRMSSYLKALTKFSKWNQLYNKYL